MSHNWVEIWGLNLSAHPHPQKWYVSTAEPFSNTNKQTKNNFKEYGKWNCAPSLPPKKWFGIFVVDNLHYLWNYTKSLKCKANSQGGQFGTAFFFFNKYNYNESWSKGNSVECVLYLAYIWTLEWSPVREVHYLAWMLKNVFVIALRCRSFFIIIIKKCFNHVLTLL